MSPRAAGILAMAAALALAVFGGSLFANPGTALLGALLIVAASILFAIGALWTLRKSWADTSWPPDVSVNAAKALRRQRRFAVVACCVSPLLIGGSIAVMILDGSLLPGGILLVLGCLDLAQGIVLLRTIGRPAKDDFWVP